MFICVSERRERGLSIVAQYARRPEQRRTSDSLGLEAQLPAWTWSRALFQINRSYFLLICLSPSSWVDAWKQYFTCNFADVHLLSIIILVHYNYVKVCFTYLNLNLHYHLWSYLLRHTTLPFSRNWLEEPQGCLLGAWKVRWPSHSPRPLVSPLYSCYFCLCEALYLFNTEHIPLKVVPLP